MANSKRLTITVAAAALTIIAVSLGAMWLPVCFRFIPILVVSVIAGRIVYRTVDASYGIDRLFSKL